MIQHRVYVMYVCADLCPLIRNKQNKTTVRRDTEHASCVKLRTFASRARRVEVNWTLQSSSNPEESVYSFFFKCSAFIVYLPHGVYLSLK